MDLNETAHQIACDFRIGATGSGNNAFAAWIGDVMESLESGSGSLDVAALTGLLQRGLEAQQVADYIALADLLQYELGPMLKEHGPKAN